MQAQPHTSSLDGHTATQETSRLDADDEEHGVVLLGTATHLVRVRVRLRLRVTVRVSVRVSLRVKLGLRAATHRRHHRTATNY